MTRDKTAEAFWRFSLAAYSRTGVADTLIRLQDQGGHNVNLVLFALWLAARGVRLDTAGLAEARAAMAKLDAEIVAPLRQLRRQLRGDPDGDVQELRRRLLALEISAERRVQARLAGCAPPLGNVAGDREAIAEANLRLIVGADFETVEADAFRQLIAAAFPPRGPA
jgi:uncharacterized protein (TIGR02444 family)